MLRSLWDEPRPPDPPRRVWRDWALVAVLLPAAVLEGIFRPDLPWRVLATIVVAGLVPTLLWRRTRPLLVLAICFVTTALATVIMGGEQLQSYVAVYFLLLPYALVRWGSGREAVAGMGIVLVNVGVSAAFGSLSPTDAFGGLAVLFGSVALGAAFRYRSRARMREIDRAKLLEREQLARDLHDTVAHHVSAMAIRAQAGLATMETRPGAAAEALRLIEAEASDALEEMRAMVRILRLPPDLTPNPRVRDLERLAGSTGDGPSVDVGIDGDLDDLPASVDAAIYRLAQESVTNARRHARHATRIEVRVAADASSVRLRVTDDGETGGGRPSPGYGLIGMAERAGLLGGTCEAGPDPGRGWTVTAVLPRGGAA